MEHGDHLREAKRHVDVVLDEKNGDRRIQFLEQRLHGVAFSGRETGHRFVQQQQSRSAGQRQRDFELALIAVGQITRERSARTPTVGIRRGASTPAPPDQCTTTAADAS